MFDNFLFSVNSVFPIFAVIAVGYFMRAKNFIDEQTIKKMNAIVFNFAVPLMLFKDVYISDFTAALDIKLIVYALVSTIVLYILLWGVSAVFIKDKKTLGAFVQGCYRGNYAIIGIGVVTMVLGGGAVSKAAVATTFVIPLYNVLAVIVLTVNSQQKSGVSGIKKAVKNICKNPLILGILAAIPFSVFHIRLPGCLESTVDYMAQLGTPLALIAIGGSISIKSMKSNFKTAVLASVIKLIITPLCFLTTAYFTSLRSAENMVILYVLYASPTAVNSYIMAANMGSDEKLASNIILTTTIFSVFTFTAGIYIFKCLSIL